MKIIDVTEGFIHNSSNIGNFSIHSPSITMEQHQACKSSLVCFLLANRKYSIICALLKYSPTLLKKKTCVNTLVMVCLHLGTLHPGNWVASNANERIIPSTRHQSKLYIWLGKKTSWCRIWAMIRKIMSWNIFPIFPPFNCEKAKCNLTKIIETIT